MEKVSVSNGNVKMGAIKSVSLPPVKTCTNCGHCARKCYALKMAKRYPSVKTAYERNLEILNSDRKSYFKQINNICFTERFFRWHVSGDIIDIDYLANMVDVANNNKHCEFLCFTKNYAVVNEYLNNAELPNNLHIILSNWGDKFACNNPYNLPTSNVILKGTEEPQNAKICGGNCFDCVCKNVGCWTLNKGETIYFYEH